MFQPVCIRLPPDLWVASTVQKQADNWHSLFVEWYDKGELHVDMGSFFGEDSPWSAVLKEQLSLNFLKLTTRILKVKKTREQLQKRIVQLIVQFVQDKRTRLNKNYVFFSCRWFRQRYFVMFSTMHMLLQLMPNTLSSLFSFGRTRATSSIQGNRTCFS